MKRLILPFVVSLFILNQGFVSASSIESLSFEVKSDGLVNAELVLGVEGEKYLNVTLFGDTFNDLKIIDENEDTLSHVGEAEVYQITTGEAERISITYSTDSLTLRSVSVWRLFVDTPTSAEILLPHNSTLLMVNTVPLENHTRRDQPRLVVPSGNNIVGYALEIKNIKELSWKEINIAHAVMDHIARAGYYDIIEGEEAWDKAVTAYKHGRYMRTFKEAVKASSVALASYEIGIETHHQSVAVKNLVLAAESEGRTSGLDEAKWLLEEADNQYLIGDYDSVKQLIHRAEELVTVEPTSVSKGYLYSVVGFCIALMCIVIFVAVRK